ncbi:unnamed protein product [Paramecium octaurelia]|uniref:Uncharacterized protein n=1 Tax=Paramecium octaurelia TaxID=43137 RepID=A0A8S1U0A5_PAROT|nr:unnamed protein product [Paramecium octaurelia]
MIRSHIHIKSQFLNFFFHPAVPMRLSIIQCLGDFLTKSNSGSPLINIQFQYYIQTSCFPD